MMAFVSSSKDFHRPFLRYYFVNCKGYAKLACLLLACRLMVSDRNPISMFTLSDISITISELDAMAAPEGKDAPESGDGDGSNAKIVMNMSAEFLCYV